MMLEYIDGVVDKTFCIREEMVKEDDGEEPLLMNTSHVTSNYRLCLILNPKMLVK